MTFRHMVRLIGYGRDTLDLIGHLAILDHRDRIPVAGQREALAGGRGVGEGLGASVKDAPSKMGPTSAC